MKEHKADITDASVPGKQGDKEAVLNTVTTHSMHVAMQQTTVSKTKNNLANEAVQLQYEFAFKDTEHLQYWTTQSTRKDSEINFKRLKCTDCYEKLLGKKKENTQNSVQNTKTVDVKVTRISKTVFDKM